MYSSRLIQTVAAGVLVTIACIPSTYIHFTRFNKNIRVNSKYITRRNKNTMIIDDEQNFYQVSNSLLLLKFNKVGDIETGTEMEEDKNYQVTGYGIRSPILQMYPKILTAVEKT